MIFDVQQLMISIFFVFSSATNAIDPQHKYIFIYIVQWCMHVIVKIQKQQQQREWHMQNICHICWYAIRDLLTFELHQF